MGRRRALPPASLTPRFVGWARRRRTRDAPSARPHVDAESLDARRRGEPLALSPAFAPATLAASRATHVVRQHLRL